MRDASLTSKESARARNRLLNEANVPTEVVLLIIAGMTLIITGALLFPISSGRLQYYQNGLYGLLLVIFAMQIMTMGKTPFGDIRRPLPLLAIGAVVATVGIVTCFVPDIYNWQPRILLFVFFGPGGLFLLLQMLISKDKYRTWKKYGGVFHQLILACSLVYLLSILTSLLILKQDLLPTGLTAVAGLVFGAAVIYLAGVLWKITATYGERDSSRGGRFEVSADNALLLFTAVYMLILGALLIPVSLKLLPFSGSAQLGLLGVLYAARMLASGSTPLGAFPRSWLLILLGLLLASLGIVSCIVPEALVSLLTYLVGVLNILGGTVSTVQTALPFVRKAGRPREPQAAAVKRLAVAQLASGLLTIMFGVSMLVSSLIPGVVLGVILVAMGFVLAYMFYLIIAQSNLEPEEVTDVSFQ